MEREQKVLDIGPFYHGTRADLKVGDLIEAGHLSNYGNNLHLSHIYFSATLEPAIWGAELARGENLERIYEVEPTGKFENDPNLTDKKFPGNPTRSYRSKSPLRIIAEITEWERHDQETISMMKANIEKVKDLKNGGIID